MGIDRIELDQEVGHSAQVLRDKQEANKIRKRALGFIILVAITITPSKVLPFAVPEAFVIAKNLVFWTCVIGMWWQMWLMAAPMLRKSANREPGDLTYVLKQFIGYGLFGALLMWWVVTRNVPHDLKNDMILITTVFVVGNLTAFFLLARAKFFFKTPSPA